MVEDINLCGYVNLKLESEYYGFLKRYDYKKYYTNGLWNDVFIDRLIS